MALVLALMIMIWIMVMIGDVTGDDEVDNYDDCDVGVKVNGREDADNDVIEHVVIR